MNGPAGSFFCADGLYENDTFCGARGGVISNLWKVPRVLVRRARPYLIRALRVLLPSRLHLLNSCFFFVTLSAPRPLFLF